MKQNEIRGKVRVCETTIDGTKNLDQALLNIKGIGHAMSRAIPLLAGLDPKRLLGELSDDEIKKLEDVIKDPIKFGLPAYMVNRANERETGKSRHVVESELVLTRKADIDMLKKIRCYRGIRHERGLPVRGQRTRSSFRKGRTVGVSREKAKPEKKS